MVDNKNAFLGGFRLWQDAQISAANYDSASEPRQTEKTNGSAVKKSGNRKGATA